MITPMNQALPAVSVAERLAERIVALDAARLPAAVRMKCEDLAVDVIGLAVAARNQDYVKAALAGWDDDGPCTAIGHERTLSAAGAAFVNGTAAHGEDFDDTFEGGPVHAGAVMVPGVLAACERYNPDGASALLGHRSRRRDAVPAQPGGAQAGAQGRLPPDRGARRHGGRGRHRRRAETATAARSSMRSASPAAWRPASLNISPRAPGPSACIPAGRRRRACAQRCSQSTASYGPRTVFEGTHGFFHGFAHTTEGDYERADR